MATDAQIAANRLNSLKSTGPKSKRGKERSRGNALRLGLYARQLVALGETDEEFAGYCASLNATLQPQDAYEALLVRRLALASWRSDRLAKLEAALMDGEARSEARRRGHPAIIPDDVWPEALAPLARHEATLDRAVQRAMMLLDRYRAARRRGELPAAPFSNPAERSQFPETLQGAARENEADLAPAKANLSGSNANSSPPNANLSPENATANPIEAIAAEMTAEKAAAITVATERIEAHGHEREE
jgi:hypothetical protein